MEKTQKHCTLIEGRIRLRVRYAEVDQMGVVHHSRYAVYFEMGRTELLRANGYEYRDLEAAGVLLAVTRLEVRFKAPARYDDELEIFTRIVKIDHVRIEHEYRLSRVGDGRLLAEAATTLVHIDRAGKLQPIPDFLKPGETSGQVS